MSSSDKWFIFFTIKNGSRKCKLEVRPMKIRHGVRAEGRGGAKKINRLQKGNTNFTPFERFHSFFLILKCSKTCYFFLEIQNF